MSVWKRVGFFVLPVMSLALAAWGQEHEHKHGAPAEKLGRVHFHVSCHEAAQKEFLRAVAMLHSFWYEEAEKTFAAVTRADPTCAMGYWGIAMSLYHPLWEPPDAATLQKGWAAIEKAKAANPKTARERDYIAAIEAYYKDYGKRDPRTRTLSFEKGIEQVYLRNPDDREAAVFYALSLLSTALPTDKIYANQKKAAAILDKVFAVEPEHPGVTHYYIHAYDSPALAPLALRAARQYAKIAPSVPHALHMPSHIFTRLGLWQESIQSNSAAVAAAADYAVKANLGGAWDQQLHAMDYLAYAYLQGAQDVEAKRVLDEMRTFRKVVLEGRTAAYVLAGIPARYALERRRWSEAAALELSPPWFPWSRYPATEAITVLARALGGARSGRAGDAQKDLERLEALCQATPEGYWEDGVEVLRREVAAWTALANGKSEQALQLMRSAVELEETAERNPVTRGSILPAREQMGDMLLELRRPADALREYEASLRDQPNRFNSLYGAARAAELSGEHDKAHAYYTKLVEISKLASGDRPELRQALTLLASK